MPKYRKGDFPRLNGQLAFGDLSSFACAPLINTPASIDTFLGNPPGTTVYGAPAAYAVTGTFFGSSAAAVQQQIDALAGLAGISAAFGYPTGIRFPDDFYWSPHPCYFLAAEFVPSAIASVPGNQYQAAYKLVLREVIGG